jgi:hypothetical protein
MEVKWEEPTRFDALGRNGYIRSCGLSVLMIGRELFLEPLTSRGEVGRARIVVPIKAVPEILDAIARECRLMLQREAPHPPDLPDLSNRRNNTNADAHGEKHIHAEVQTFGRAERPPTGANQQNAFCRLEPTDRTILATDLNSPQIWPADRHRT